MNTPVVVVDDVAKTPESAVYEPEAQLRILVEREDFWEAIRAMSLENKSLYIESPERKPKGCCKHCHGRGWTGRRVFPIGRKNNEVVWKPIGLIYCRCITEKKTKAKV